MWWLITEETVEPHPTAVEMGLKATRGAQLLDKHLPLWYKEIDEANIVYPCTNTGHLLIRILENVYGDGTGSNGFRIGIEALDLGSGRIYEHGFMVSLSDDDRLAMIASAWREEIRNRRKAWNG
jgi:hypothetical protein